MRKGLKGTWRQALFTFCLPVFLVIGVRWLLFEPYVIPTGSMIPSLLIHDHIFVSKFSFGIQMPFAPKLLVQWAHPKAGDIVVFRFPENPDVFYVKRILAVGGDEISVEKGVVKVNGRPYPQEVPSPEEMKQVESGFDYFKETSSHSYLVRYSDKDSSNFGPLIVPAGRFFVIGDNRDHSYDSRYWGSVPEDYLLGKAQVVWLSCEETLATAQFLCDPATLRWDRFLKKIE